MDMVTACYISYCNVTMHTEMHYYRTQWSSAVMYRSTLVKTESVALGQRNICHMLNVMTWWYFSTHNASGIFGREVKAKAGNNCKGETGGWIEITIDRLFLHRLQPEEMVVKLECNKKIHWWYIERDTWVHKDMDSRVYVLIFIRLLFLLL